MHQKIRDFELIIDENSKEHIEALKKIKSEMENYKMRNFENEKFFDILNYFFKKMNFIYIDYDNKESTSSISKLTDDKFQNNFNDLKSLQNKLIELENFLIKIINEKNLIHQKYSKILEIQTKIANSESNEYTQMHLENLKKLNEKIFDLTEENKILKKQIQEESDQNKKDSFKFTKDFDRIEKENIFTNNYNKEILNRESYNHMQNLSNNQSNLKKSTANNFKTLEERVLELERELNLRERNRQLESEDNFYGKNSVKNISNKKARRSKSSTKRNSLCNNNEDYDHKFNTNSLSIHNTKSNISVNEERDIYESNEDKKEKKKTKNKSNKFRYNENNSQINIRDKSVGVIHRKENVIENRKSYIGDRNKNPQNLLRVGIRK